MHTNNLGIYLIINAEALLMLAEHRRATWGCELHEALKHVFIDFKGWCARTHVACSQRRWTTWQLHLKEGDADAYPWLISKAFNARVMLAFFADAGLFKKKVANHPHPQAKDQLHSLSNDLLAPFDAETRDAHALRVQLWTAGIAAVFLGCAWFQVFVCVC